MHWFENLGSILSITHKTSRHKLRQHLIYGFDTMGLSKYTVQVLFSVAIHTTKRKERLPTLSEMSALIIKLTRIDSFTN